MRRASFGAVAIAVAALFSSVPARANGRFPQSNQFVFSPTDKNFVVLRATYGVLPSHDNGTTWSFLCEEALGLTEPSYVDPTLGVTTNNSLIGGTPLGLNVSPDMGCTWHCASGALTGQAVVDLAVRPDNPSSAVVLTGTPLPPDAGAGQLFSQVFETTDNGTTWAALGVPLPPAVLVTTVDVAKSDPQRLYVSGTRSYGGSRTAALFVSTDKGVTWTERALPAAQFDPTTEDSVYIGTIDPTNADRVYIRSASLATGGRSRLTVTADAGQTFSTAYSFTVPASPYATVDGQMQGFALSSDGSRIFIGSQRDGLWSASTTDLAFHQTSNIHVQCLATRSTAQGDELWACSDAVSGFIAGVSTDNGATFTAKMSLVTQLSGPISCGPDTSLACLASGGASQCPASFANFCASYDNGTCSASLDGGGTSGVDAGRSTSAGSTPAKSSGCTSAGGPGRPGRAPALLAILALGGLGWRVRRRRREVQRVRAERSSQSGSGRTR